MTSVLDDFHPSLALSITYPRTHQLVDLGNTLPVDDVQSSPDLRVHPTSDSAAFPSSQNMTYALILTDPDATSRSDPKSSEYLHWIATMVTDLSSLSDIAAQANELIKYAPPAPPPKTGKHRYVFVLLAGPEGTKLTKPAERPHWGYGKVRHGVRDWAEENGLVVLGECWYVWAVVSNELMRIPGANFFYAQNKQQ